MSLPNFLIIGAAKSGTSSLYIYLKQHPEIFMSPKKEPHFFSFTSETKMTKGPGDTIPLAITDPMKYEQLFDGASTEKIIGEASTSYLYINSSAQRIKNQIPNLKMVAILRQPAERAFSAYMHLIRDRRETAKSFSKALELEQDRKANHWDPIWHYTSVGFYYQQLKRYYEMFDQQQIKVFLYEDLLHHSSKLLRDIFHFLEVDESFIPDSSVKFNVSGKQKNTTIHNLSMLIFNTPNPIRWASRKIISENVRWKFTSWVRENNLQKQEIPSAIRKKLTLMYRDDILRLQGLIDRDLTHWLRN